MDRESLAVLIARGLSVEKIAERFGKHPSTVSYWMAKYGLRRPTGTSTRRRAGSHGSAWRSWSRRA